ncbi:hypothetical protein MRX96_006397 [Rhipicephalus microplus]
MNGSWPTSSVEFMEDDELLFYGDGYSKNDYPSGGGHDTPSVVIDRINYSSFSGVTGIPTRTTATLTPTTLKNIEETFLEYQRFPPGTSGACTPGRLCASCSQHCSVPAAATAAAARDGGDQAGGGRRLASPPALPHSSWSSKCSKFLGRLTTHPHHPHRCLPSQPAPVGGRRPNRNEKLSPEEEERRRIRRERNKLAAARCRKRRMDHTNSLIKETEELEEAKNKLQQEMAALRSEKENLEFLLEAHKASCKIPHVKCATTTASTMSTLPQQRPQHLPIVTSADSGHVRNNHKLPNAPSRAPQVLAAQLARGYLSVYKLGWGAVP